MKKIISILVITLIITISCEVSPPVSMVSARVSWKIGDVASNMLSMIPSISGTNSRSLFSPSRVLLSDISQPVSTLYNQFYSGIGDIIDLGELTPSEIRIPLHSVAIKNPDSIDYVQLYFGAPDSVEDENDTDGFYADFTSAISVTDFKEIESGTYSSFFIYLEETGVQASFSSLGDYQFYLIPSIIIELPGYTDIELPNIGSDFSGFPNGNYDRKYIGNNQFRFTWKQLQPDFSLLDGFDSSNTIPAMFFGQVDELRAILPGLPGFPLTFDTYELTEEIWNSPGTNRGMLFAPFNGLVIPEDANSVEIVFAFNSTDVIQVYDNGTIGDKTDDIVVFAPFFWERFSISVNVID